MQRPNFHPAAQAVDFDRWEREMWHDLGRRISPPRTRRQRWTDRLVLLAGAVVTVAFWYAVIVGLAAVFS